jgi:hypothetical protein
MLLKLSPLNHEIVNFSILLTRIILNPPARREREYLRVCCDGQAHNFEFLYRLRSKKSEKNECETGVYYYQKQRSIFNDETLYFCD